MTIRGVINHGNGVHRMKRERPGAHRRVGDEFFIAREVWPSTRAIRIDGNSALEHDTLKTAVLTSADLTATDWKVLR